MPVSPEAGRPKQKRRTALPPPPSRPFARGLFARGLFVRPDRRERGRESGVRRVRPVRVERAG